MTLSRQRLLFATSLLLSFFCSANSTHLSESSSLADKSFGMDLKDVCPRFRVLQGRFAAGRGKVFHSNGFVGRLSTRCATYTSSHVLRLYGSTQEMVGCQALRNF